jgi:hypothetical protein
MGGISLLFPEIIVRTNPFEELLIIYTEEGLRLKNAAFFFQVNIIRLQGKTYVTLKEQKLLLMMPHTTCKIQENSSQNCLIERKCPRKTL